MRNERYYYEVERPKINDLLRRIHDFLETIEEWVGWDYQDECERLEGEIEEVLNRE